MKFFIFNFDKIIRITRLRRLECYISYKYKHFCKSERKSSGPNIVHIFDLLIKIDETLSCLQSCCIVLCKMDKMAKKNCKKSYLV